MGKVKRQLICGRRAQETHDPPNAILETAGSLQQRFQDLRGFSKSSPIQGLRGCKHQLFPSSWGSWGPGVLQGRARLKERLQGSEERAPTTSSRCPSKTTGGPTHECRAQHCGSAGPGIPAGHSHLCLCHFLGSQPLGPRRIKWNR